MILLFIPVTCFVTFADKKYSNTLNRIRKEAFDMKVFDEIYAFDEDDLDKEFKSKHREFIENNKRGYGYWIWKPQVIKQILSKIPENSVIVYADAGCTLDRNKRRELQEYIYSFDQKGVIAFEWFGDTESKLTKMDCIHTIFKEGEKTRPFIATAVMFKKTKFSVDFVDEWLKYCESDNYHLLDDSPSVLKNTEDFYEHRHDQSIFSLLCKKYDIKYLPNTLDTHSGPIKATRIRN